MVLKTCGLSLHALSAARWVSSVLCTRSRKSFKKRHALAVAERFIRPLARYAVEAQCFYALLTHCARQVFLVERLDAPAGEPMKHIKARPSCLARAVTRGASVCC